MSSSLQSTNSGEKPARPVVLTGDRTTGQLHLGHFVGSLRNRVKLQDSHQQYVLLADLQAMTDNGNDPRRVASNVVEVALDYLAVGIDPAKTTICLQSQLPVLSELALLYLNYVTVARLERNPTIKEEIRQRGFERDIPAGFLCYPVSQAADITAFRATVVPVGDDQLPMLEQTNEIVRRINRLVGSDYLPEAQPLLSSTSRLPGADGRTKMSKSQGNALVLSASDDEIRQTVKNMYTDPNHLKVSDPGKVEGNVVFSYLDAFDTDVDGVAELKAHYQRGGLGDSIVKRRLEACLIDVIAPIRERREQYSRELGHVREVIKTGTLAARAVTEEVFSGLKDALGIYRL
jgi:tryptophanyl-tRNA synthetase